MNYEREYKSRVYTLNALSACSSAQETKSLWERIHELREGARTHLVLTHKLQLSTQL